MADLFYKSFIKANRWQMYLQGLGITMWVTVLAAALGIALGTLACLFNMQRTKDGRRTIGSMIAYVYIDVIRGTPTMIQLLIMWNVIMASSRNKIFVAVMAFGINSGAYVAEILRGGIQSVDPGQMEAGRSLGMTRWETMISVVLPQAFKNCFPSLLNEFITLLKETSIASAVGLRDLTHAADLVSASTYEIFMPLLIAALMYYIVIKVLSILFNKLERRLRESDIR
ncbi:MAG: amino acid ABC transporter permease [Lachnospiraceae bacterium]|jgi:His/Glu/Gln/Arg/opine family amino acid ABC transporter permease subunit